jgi:DNA-binding NtrC family response regulator
VKPDTDEPSTFAHARFDPSEPPEASFVLSVVDGADRGHTVAVDGSMPGNVLVGSSSVCAMRLSDRGVSRRHAAFEIEGRRLRVTDVGSTNGLFVGDVEVRSALLSGGETLRLGSTLLSVERHAAAATTLSRETGFGRVLGASREMRRLYPLCQRLSAAQVPVVIEGETGTGKEVLAESLHEMGARAEGPFVVFDCTAVPPSLVEAELFGHERGAFTGAAAQRKGVFEQADGGTLFIDEIGELDLVMQPKLLRALERSEVRRIGGDRWIRVDVRVLAATRRDLDAEVEHGRFRDDLFHRLAVARIELPPLRDRRGDIALLARAFASQLGSPGAAVPADLMQRWERHAWPGNVRELRNAVARYLALGDTVTRGAGGSGGDVIARVLAERLPLARAREQVIEEFEQRYVEDVLEQHGGNVSRAAEASGVARRYFQILKARRRR